MKRIVLVMLAACLAVGLAACGGGEPAPGETNGAESNVVDSTTLPDAQTMARAFLDGEVFSETLEELDLDVAYRLYALEDYGVAREGLTGGAVYGSTGATAEEVAVLIFSDAGTAQTAKEALEDHIDSQKESYEEYIPAEIPKLDEATVTICGDTLILVVPADADKAAAVVTSFVPA